MRIGALEGKGADAGGLRAEGSGRGSQARQVPADGASPAGCYVQDGADVMVHMRQMKDACKKE